MIKKNKIKILFIGNSYSENTASFMPAISKALNLNMEVYYLYKGGCSLDEHWKNCKNSSKKYLFCQVKNSIYHNNRLKIINKKSNIKSALIYQNWDWIVLQQTSRTSGDISTYSHLDSIITYIKRHLLQPNATRFAFNMTWSYSSTHKQLHCFYKDQEDMYNSTCGTIRHIVNRNKDISLILPTGIAIQEAREKLPQGSEYTLDGSHLNTQGCLIASLSAALALHSYYEAAPAINKDFYKPKLDRYVNTQNSKRLRIKDFNPEFINIALKSIK